MDLSCSAALKKVANVDSTQEFAQHTSFVLRAAQLGLACQFRSPFLRHFISLSSSFPSIYFFLSFGLSLCLYFCLLLSMPPSLSLSVSLCHSLSFHLSLSLSVIAYFVPSRFGLTDETNKL